MAVEPSVPVIEHIKQQEKECDEGKGLGGIQQGAVAVRPVAGQEADGHDPEVREDEVEEEDVTGVGGKEEGGEVENGCEDRLLTMLASQVNRLIIRAMPDFKMNLQ